MFTVEPITTTVTEETLKADHDHEVSESLATGTTFGEQAVYYDDVEW
jgi:hypothetical protein